MDKNTARDLLLTGFKPREKNIDTPYLVTADGRSLDGELKLVSLPGVQAIETRQMATDQVIGDDGKVTYKLNSAKWIGLLIIRTLYHRESNEPLLSQLIPSNGDAADLQELLGMDDGPFEELGEAVREFLNAGSKAVSQVKNVSKVTQNSDGGSELPKSSDAPSANVNEDSTMENSSNG